VTVHAILVFVSFRRRSPRLSRNGECAGGWKGVEGFFVVLVPPSRKSMDQEVGRPIVQIREQERQRCDADGRVRL